MTGTVKGNKTITEKFFEYLKYHPVSGRLLILFFVGYLSAITVSVLFENSRIISFYQIAYFFLLWFPSVPIALKTRNKYSIYTAIGPVIVLLFLFVSYVFTYLFFAVTKINIDVISMTKEQPVILALFILTIIFGFFVFLVYLAIKYQKSGMWIHSLWVQKGGVLGNTADGIYSSADGYSERPYSHRMKSSGLDFSVMENFAKLLAKNLIIVNWKNRENSVKMWFITRKNFIEYLDVFYSENLGSWIELNKDGKLTVFIAREDYKNIYREVTYHILCRNIAEKFEQSFMEFANGRGNNENNKLNSIKILRGDGR